jgi:hypothetical protein
MGAVAAILAQEREKDLKGQGTVLAQGKGEEKSNSKNNNLFDAMVLDCPFDSSKNIIERGLDHFKFKVAGYSFDVPGKSFLKKYAFHPYVQSLLRFVLRAVANMDSRGISMRVFPVDPVKSVAKVEVPTFYILCKQDKKVTIDAIKQVYENTASSYKQLWLTNGRFHFDSYFYNPEKYTELVRAFFDQVASGNVNSTIKHEIVEDEDDGPLVA